MTCTLLRVLHGGATTLPSRFCFDCTHKHSISGISEHEAIPPTLTWRDTQNDLFSSTLSFRQSWCSPKAHSYRAQGRHFIVMEGRGRAHPQLLGHLTMLSIRLFIVDHRTQAFREDLRLLSAPPFPSQTEHVC